MHGAAVGLRVFGLEDEREFVIGHRGAEFAREGAEEEAGGFLAGFEHVDVGVGVVADDGGGEGDHALGDVGVEVEGEDDGLVGAKDFAGDREERPSTSSSPWAVWAPCMARRRASGLAAARPAAKALVRRAKSARRQRLAVMAQAAQMGATVMASVLASVVSSTSRKPPISVSLPRWRSSTAGPKTGLKSS